jgi:hypothetical protein
MNHRWRLLPALALAASFALTSCDDGGKQGTPPTPSTAPSNTAPSGVSAPALQTTGEDFDAIVRSLSAYRTWVSRHPDPAAFGAIYSERCPCLATDQAKYADYVAKGQRWDDEGIQIVEVRVLQRLNPNLVRLRVVTRHGPQRLVDRNGILVRDGPGWAPFAHIYELARSDPNAQWKVSLIDDVGPLESGP